MNDGRFPQLSQYQLGAQVYIAGTYRLPGPGVLRMDILQAEPRPHCGPLGCTPIHYPDGETHYSRLVDRNTLVLQLVCCQQGVCRFTYRRVQ